MSYTGTEIHNMAIAVLDEISPNGTIDAAKTKEYANRAPYLIELGQRELSDVGGLYFIEEYENTDEEETYKWTKFTLPADFRSIKQVIFEDEHMQLPPISYRQFGMTELYIFFKDVGTARVLYVPIPTKITALTQTLQIDENIATALAYYNAQHYAIADQNTDLAAMCEKKFNQIVSKLTLKLPAEMSEIVDAYGTNWGGY